jgi:D-alanine-D-alanine ligase
MRVALTYNEKRSARESDAELDTLETIAMLAGWLVELGHEVVPVEVSSPVDVLAAELRGLVPDLVFNLAEGRHGRFREAFFAALYEQLGVPHTGSDACALAICLDKALAKRLVAAAGIAVPRGVVVRDRGDLVDVPLPAIVKPIYEGSSKGITQASVVSDLRELRRAVVRVLARYPEGVLVEQLIEGVDAAVAWVAELGVCTALTYEYEPSGRHRILDRDVKRAGTVRSRIPPALDGPAARALADAGARAFAALGVTGYGRADFRVTPAGVPYFLEMNPLPSLAAIDDEIYVAASSARASPRDVIAAIVAAARVQASPMRPAWRIRSSSLRNC